MDKPVLSPMQRAWLLELGIDARMLSHFSAEPFGGGETAPGEAHSGGARSPAAIAGSDAPATPAPLASEFDAGARADARPGLPAGRAEAAGGAGPASIGEVLKRMPLGTAAGALPAAVRGPEPDAGPSARAAPEQGAIVPDGTTLAGLRRQAEECTACGLHEVRGRVVFGEGAEQAPRWMFVGEAPGEYDDSTGRPFQGRAGELLQAMLSSVGITDAAPVYFTNVLKCRPMGNRSPQAAEVAACLPRLRRQITLLRPGCLVALGRVSAGALLERGDELDALRGSVHAYVDEDGRSIPLVVTHHPASLLLHAQLKADAWRDLNLLRDLGA